MAKGTLGKILDFGSREDLIRRGRSRARCKLDEWAGGPEVDFSQEQFDWLERQFRGMTRAFEASGKATGKLRPSEGSAESEASRR